MLVTSTRPSLRTCPALIQRGDDAFVAPGAYGDLMDALGKAHGLRAVGENTLMDYTLRAQYHLRESPAGLLSWDVRRLVALSAGLPVVDVPLAALAEIDKAHGYAHGQVPTCRSVAEHCALIRAADDRLPMILDLQGRVMDGMHRVCKRLMAGQPMIAAVRFIVDPAPDFVGVHPDDLPYAP